MSTTFMAKMLIKARGALVVFLALFVGVGCVNKNSSSTINEGCDSGYAKIIQTILSDESLKNYAGSYLRSGRNIVLVWDDAPSSMQACAADKINFRLVNSSEFIAKENDEYIIITKLYYDESAAFVELLLQPTEKNGDFFLRKENEWKITKKDFWESSD